MEKNSVDQRHHAAADRLGGMVLMVAEMLHLLFVAGAAGAQLKLFDNIKPLFSNKPLLMVVNKCDIVPPESIPDETKAMITKSAGDTPFICMSNHRYAFVLRASLATTACAQCRVLQRSQAQCASL